jgi:hypothetical protein
LEKDAQKLSTPAQILKCITRDIKTDGDMTVFQLYWEVLLPKMIGAKESGMAVFGTTTPFLRQETLRMKKSVL